MTRPHMSPSIEFVLIELIPPVYGTPLVQKVRNPPETKPIECFVFCCLSFEGLCRLRVVLKKGLNKFIKRLVSVFLIVIILSTTESCI